MLKKINLGFLALVMGLSLTLLSSAFKSADKARADKIWYFQSNLIGDAADASKYSLVTPPPTSCGIGLDLPCYIQAPESVDTQPELVTYIHDTYNDSPSNVYNAAPEKREEQ